MHQQPATPCLACNLRQLRHRLPRQARHAANTQCRKRPVCELSVHAQVKQQLATPQPGTAPPAAPREEPAEAVLIKAVTANGGPSPAAQLPATPEAAMHAIAGSAEPGLEPAMAALAGTLQAPKEPRLHVLAAPAPALTLLRAGIQAWPTKGQVRSAHAGMSLKSPVDGQRGPVTRSQAKPAKERLPTSPARPLSPKSRHLSSTPQTPRAPKTPRSSARTADGAKKGRLLAFLSGGGRSPALWAGPAMCCRRLVSVHARLRCTRIVGAHQHDAETPDQGCPPLHLCTPLLPSAPLCTAQPKASKGPSRASMPALATLQANSPLRVQV